MLMSDELKTQIFNHIIDSRIDYAALMKKKQVGTKALFDISADQFLVELHEHVTTHPDCLNMIREMEDYVELKKLSDTLCL